MTQDGRSGSCLMFNSVDVAFKTCVLCDQRLVSVAYSDNDVALVCQLLRMSCTMLSACSKY